LVNNELNFLVAEFQVAIANNFVLSWQHCRLDVSRSLHFDQGCQVAVTTAPLLKSGRRKSEGAVENLGP
jgi:hypothetical protein